MKMNSEYFVSQARTFEKHYGVEFSSLDKEAVTDPSERLIQFAEAHLDQESIVAGVRRFAQERAQRLDRQRARLDALG